MTLDDEDIALLFLLEVVVHSVKLVDEGADTKETPLQVVVRFIDLPIMKIRQDEFTDVLTTSKSEGFFCGNSCLFSRSPRQLLASINENPLTLTVYRLLQDAIPPDILGHTSVVLSNGMSEMIRKVTENPEDVPVTSSYFKDAFPLVNNKNDIVGEISVFVRLSCTGETIISQIQMLDDEDAYLFKNTLQDANGILQDPRRQESSPILTEVAMTKETDMAPMMYSLEDARRMYHDDTNLYKFESIAGERIKQTFKHVLYELNQIGDLELPRFQPITYQPVVKFPKDLTVSDDTTLMYNLSETQKIFFDGNLSHEESDEDMLIIEGELQCGRTLFYCMNKDEPEKLEQGLEQPCVCVGFPSGVCHIPENSKQPSLQYQQIPFTSKYAESINACDLSNRKQKMRWSHTEKYTGITAEHSIIPTSKSAQLSCACNDRSECNFPDSIPGNFNVPGQKILNTHQQKNIRKQVVNFTTMSSGQFSGKSRDITKSPRTLSLSKHLHANGNISQSSEMVCFPTVEYQHRACTATKCGCKTCQSNIINEQFLRAGRGTAAPTVVWRIPARQKCMCVYRRHPQVDCNDISEAPVRLSDSSEERSALPIGVQHTRSYIPINPPVRYDTTSKLSPAGRGDAPIEAQPHPLVRYDTTSKLSPAYNHPPVRYDTTGMLSPAAMATQKECLPLKSELPFTFAELSILPEHEREEEVHVLSVTVPGASTQCTCCCCCCCRCIKCTCRVKITTIHEKAAKMQRNARSCYYPLELDPSLPRRQHRCYVPEFSGIPSNMGWLWTASSLPVHAGWRPGYIVQSVRRRIKEHMRKQLQLSHPTEVKKGLSSHFERASLRGKGYSRYTQKSMHQKTATPRTEHQSTLQIVQRKGMFYVKLAGKDPQQEPLHFRIPGCDDSISPDSDHSWPLSSRSSDINLEFMSPADLLAPPKPVCMHSTGVQFEERDLPVIPEVPQPPASSIAEEPVSDSPAVPTDRPKRANAKPPNSKKK